MSNRLMRLIRDESGQVSGPAAVVAPTAVLGARVVGDQVLPATGVAIGIYVLIALVCLLGGLTMRMWSRRLARVS